MMYYNQKQHQELLKKKETDLNDQNQQELMKYDRILIDQLFWQERHRIILILEDYLNNRMTEEDFCNRIFGFRREFLYICEKVLLEIASGQVNNFPINHQSKNLSEFLTSIYIICDSREDYIDTEFYDEIQNSLLNFQVSLDKEVSKEDELNLTQELEGNLNTNEILMSKQTLIILFLGILILVGLLLLKIL